MDASTFRALLADGPVLADGGMGTALIARGAAPEACLEDLNIRAPEHVEAVHRGFVEAGARLVLTNTFGASRFRLERHGMAERVAAICRAAVPLARHAGAEIVAGSMGPLGVRLAPYGRVPLDEAFDACREQASALAEGGVDLLIVETQSDLREVEQAVAAAREGAPGLAVVATATFTRDDRTLLGSTPEEVAATLAGLDVDGLGANCGEGPAQILRVVEAMRPHARGLPLVARPNAGGPAEIGGRFVYPATPEYVAELADALVDRGVAILGGCCGTGPEHTLAMASTLRARARRRSAAPAPAAVVAAPSPGGSAEVTGSSLRPTALASALSRGDLVVAVEMEPPRSFNAAALVAAAGTLRDAGADVIDVADSPMAKMRMSAWAACRLIQEQVGVETTLHFPTRGRNLLRLQGDLLGAHALGIRNLFVCVGDPVTIGDYPQGSGTVDVTATGLLALIEEGFNAGVDQAGSSIGEPTSFFAGAAVALGARDLQREVRLTRRKVDSGARFLLSQPLYEIDPLRRFRRTYEYEAGEPLPVPILVGVLPLSSARHAAFLHNEVPGVTIPERVRARMEAAGDEGGVTWREGLAIAADLIDRFLVEGIAGIYVMPQFGRYDRAAEVIEVARRAGPGT